MKLMKTARFGAALLGFAVAMSCAAFAQTTEDNSGRGSELPAGIQDNEGLAEHGKGDTQGKHKGWTKAEKEVKKTEKAQEKETKKQEKESKDNTDGN
jgi:hypothetical protein